MSTKDKAPTTNRFVQLTADLPTIAGMRRSGNPASLPPFLFRDMENIAMRGNDVIERGGQAKYNPHEPLEGCGDEFVPPDQEPRETFSQLVSVGGWSEEAAPLVYWDAGYIQVATVVRATSLTYIPGAGPDGSGGVLYIGTGTTSADITPAGWDGAVIDENGELQLNGETFQIAADDSRAHGGLVEFESELYGVASGDDNGTLHTQIIADPFVTAVVVRESLALGGFYPMWLVNLADSYLVAPLERNILHFLEAGTTTWATATLPGFSDAYIDQPHAAAVHDGTLYFTGAGFEEVFSIFNWAGGAAAATTEHSVNGNIEPGGPLSAAGEGWGPLCSHMGALYFAYKMTGDVPIIGRFSTLGGWVDNVFSFPAGTEAVRALISNNGRLWAFCGTTLWSSDFPDRSERWRLEASLTSVGGGPFVYAATQVVI